MGRGWPRLNAALSLIDLALAGRAGGGIGQSLCAAVFHTSAHGAAVRRAALRKAPPVALGACTASERAAARQERRRACLAAPRRIEAARLYVESKPNMAGQQ